ncbi:MAG: histidinol-phosphate transaminase [Planctomycetota bacterium]
MSYFRANIEKTSGYVPGFQPSEAEVVKLNTNENPYPPSPRVIKAVRQIGVEQLRRYPNSVGQLFRESAAKCLGLGGPEYIMCTNGGDELLTIAFRAFCDEGRAAAYPVPTYTLYPVLATLQNCRAIEVPFGDGFRLPGELGRAGVALTIVCNPNAPTTTFIEPSAIRSLAEEVGGVLLVDEAYVDFAESNCLGLVEKFDNMIILRSMSKGYSLAGMRFGFAVAQPKLIEGLMKVKDSYNVNAAALAAATAAVEDQEYHRECVEKIKAERGRLGGELAALGFEVPASSTNFLLAGCRGRKAKEIYEELARRHIYVRYFDYPELRDKLRITVGTAQQNDKLIEALRKII